MNTQPDTTDQADDLVLFKNLMQRPNVAWPTIILLLVSFIVFSLSTIAYVEGILPLF